MNNITKIMLIILFTISVFGIVIGSYIFFSAVDKIDYAADVAKEQIEKSKTETTPTDSGDEEPTEPLPINLLPAKLPSIDGVLIFPSQKDHSIAVFSGTSKLILQYGAGRASGTAMIGELGNSVVYGHRDSNFNALSNLEVGDIISYQNSDETMEFEITEIYITTPNDPDIFETTENAQLTLVTCYPFVFSGPANERIVFISEKI